MPLNDEFWAEIATFDDRGLVVRGYLTVTAVGVADDALDEFGQPLGIEETEISRIDYVSLNTYDVHVEYANRGRTHDVTIGPSSAELPIHPPISFGDVSVSVVRVS